MKIKMRVRPFSRCDYKYAVQMTAEGRFLPPKKPKTKVSPRPRSPWSFLMNSTLHHSCLCMWVCVFFKDKCIT